jgi:anti-sigma factor RsiW
MTDDVRETLTAYLDGELDEIAEQALEARLSQEPALRAELDALKQAWGLLDFLPGTVPSNDFTHRTLDRLSFERSSTLSLKFKRGWPLRRGALWLASALIALGVGIAASASYRKFTHKPTDPDEPIVRHLRLLERLQAYDTVDDLEFLKALDDPDLFGDNAL